MPFAARAVHRANAHTRRGLNGYLCRSVLRMGRLEEWSQNVVAEAALVRALISPVQIKRAAHALQDGEGQRVR